nr:glutamate synthase subunit alpha [Lachnospiraceae bacterium]
ARELREYMAKLGVRTLNEMTGRSDLLKKKDDLKGNAARIDISDILELPPIEVSGEPAGFEASEKSGRISTLGRVFNPERVYDFELEKTKDEKDLLNKTSVKNAIKSGKKCREEIQLTNTDRTFGTLLGSEITRQNKEGLAEDTISIDCVGHGGQSFGAFIPKGLTLTITGDSNDYIGKGLSGGKIVVKAPSDAGYDAENNIIIGNVALYGATSGEAYFEGMAGERFAVRNSGAHAVVEGVGEHGCEYMTGGRVVVIGPTGKNFAAGMSGGVAYVLDEHNTLYRNLNKDLVLMEPVENKNDCNELKAMLEKHAALTGSLKAKAILDDFAGYLPKFKKIIPENYKKLMILTGQFEEKGMSYEEAQVEAFYVATTGVQD